MKIGRKKKCKYCRRLFTPDKRVWKRQTTCRLAACQRQRKQSNNQGFKKANPDYWKGRYKEVKAWRKKNPDHQRRWREKKKEEDKNKSRGEIQAERVLYVLDSIDKNVGALREIQAEILRLPLDIARDAPLLSHQAP